MTDPRSGGPTSLELEEYRVEWEAKALRALRTVLRSRRRDVGKRVIRGLYFMVAEGEMRGRIIGKAGGDGGGEQDQKAWLDALAAFLRGLKHD